MAFDADVPIDVSEPPARHATAHFGGPDRPKGALRDLLEARIHAAQPGSEILWATYYFRDRGLAEALIAARRRGVRVRVVVDGQPRRRDANDAVIAQLRQGLGPDLKVHRPLLAGPRLHAKIYAFSGPEPRVFVGSFNPSGDQPEDPAVLADIGDQDRGHNLLIEFRNPAVVRMAQAQAERLWRGEGASRLSARQNRTAQAGDVRLYFFPRLRPLVLESSLQDLRPGDRVRGAISHFEAGPLAWQLAAAARRGADVDLVVHDTDRRVPTQVVAALARAGVDVRRYCHPDGVPMHAKFVIVERSGRRTAWFGSLNFNRNSQFLNHEILVRSRQPQLVAELDARFDHIRREAALAEVAGREPARLQAAGLVRVAFDDPRPAHGRRVLPHSRACDGPAAGQRPWASRFVAEARSRLAELVRRLDPRRLAA